MTVRERWFLAGLVLAFFGLAALSVWNQARYQDVRDAVRRYVLLDARQEQEPTEKVALIRQAKPEVRRSLLRGEFEAALKRLKSLEQEDAASQGGPGAVDAIPIAKLWPEKSSERKRLRAVLEELVRKQSQGYDVVPAQQKLVEVARAARAGKRKEALTAFDEAAALVRDAPLRPGFKAPVQFATAAAGSPGAALSSAELQQIEQLVQQLRAYRTAVPQLMARPEVTEPQRRALRAAQELFDALIAAHEQKRDLRPILPVLKPFERLFQEAQKTGEWEPVIARVKLARETVKSLPQLPAVGEPAATVPRTPPPVLPAVPPSPPAPRPTMPRWENPEQLLQLLDFLRALPEEKYRAERPRIGQGLEQLWKSALSARSQQAVRVGREVQLHLGSQGEVLGLELRGSGLTPPGTKAGGLSLQPEGQPELPIRAPLTANQSGSELHARGPQGTLSLHLAPEANGLTMRVRGTRMAGAPDTPAALLFTLPVNLGGWYWQSDPEPRPITVDGSYRHTPVDGTLSKLTLRGAAADLTLDAPTAAEVLYHAPDQRLVIRLPLPTAPGEIEHTIRLNSNRR